MTGVPLQPYAAPAGLSAVNATVLSSVATNHGETRDAHIAGEYLYGFAGSNLDVYDLHKPSAPSFLSTVAIPVGGTETNADIAGRYAVSVSGSGNTFNIFDISNPAAVSVLGTLTDATNLNGCQGVRTVGRYAFVACNNNKLTVIDISNPAVPVVVATLTDATNLVGASDIAIQGRYAYIATGSAGHSLAVVDISTPAAPTVVGSAAGNATASNNRVQVQGRYAFTSGAGSLAVYDISNPAAPTMVLNLSDAGFTLPLRMTLAGNLLCYCTQQDPTLFTLVDITDPPNAQVIKTLIANAFSDHNFACAFYGRFLYTLNYYLTTTDLVGVTGTDNARDVDSLKAGRAYVRDELNVAGRVRVGSGLVVGQNGIRSEGDLSARSLAGTGSVPAIAAGAGAGTGPTVAITGTDTSGQITVTTGTATGAGVLATVTFAKARTAAPAIALTPGNAATAAAVAQVYRTASATTFTVSAASALTVSTPYVWDYHVIG